MIKFQCECGRKIAAPDQWLGKRVKCPQCGKPVLVQESASVAPAVHAEPAPQSAAEERYAPNPTADSSPVAGSVADAEPHTAATDIEPHPTQSRFDIDQNDDTNAAPRSFPQTSGEEAGEEDTNSVGIKDNGDKPPEHIAPAVSAPARPVFVAPNAPPARQEDHDEVSRGRAPLFLGILALLTGIVGAVLYWVPTVESYVSPIVAGCGLFLAFIGLVLSLRRERAGLLFPVLAIVLGLVVLSLPWVLPAIQGTTSHSANAPAKEWAPDKTDAANETMRRMIIAVDSLQLTGDKGGPTGVVEYRLTNKGNNAIKSVAGSIQLYDKDHKLLGALALDLPDFGKTPLAPGASTSRKSTWPMDSRIQQPLMANQATAEYRAEVVTYADGSVEKFDK
jgi:hypothetical protein